MNIDQAADKAIYLRQHPAPREEGAPEVPADTGADRCWVCLRALDEQPVRRRMVWLCSRHAKQDLGTFYMRMTDTGRFHIFPGEE